MRLRFVDGEGGWEVPFWRGLYLEFRRQSLQKFKKQVPFPELREHAVQLNSDYCLSPPLRTQGTGETCRSFLSEEASVDKRGLLQEPIRLAEKFQQLICFCGQILAEDRPACLVA